MGEKSITKSMQARITGVIPQDLFSRVKRMSQATKLTPSMIVRQALQAFLEPVDQVYHISPQTEPKPALEPLSAPREAPAYRGDGRSDHPALMRLNAKAVARKESGQAGERLSDTTPVR